jgi:starvation-inducible outer membrane lipoprotein
MMKKATVRTLSIITVSLALAGCAIAPSAQQQRRPACTSIGTTMYCQ